MLGSEIRLLAVGNSEFVGITRGTTPNEILVTTSNSVILYEVSSQKPLTNWSTSINQVLQIPAIYDPLNKCFLTVINGNVVRKWTASGDRIESGSKITLPSSVFAMYSVEDSSDIILLYDNGIIAFLNDSSEQIQLNLATEHSIILSHVLKFHGQIHIGIISAGQNVVDPVFHHVILDTGGKTNAYKTRALPKNIIIKNMQLYPSLMDEIEIAILGSDASLSVGLIKHDTVELQWKNLCPINEPICPKLVAMTALKNSIIFVFMNHNSDVVCLLYNRKFEAPTVNKVMKRSSDVSQLHFYNVDDKVLLVLGNELLLLPHTEDASSLSDVLGVHNKEKTEKTLGFETPLIWTTEGLKETDSVLPSVHGTTTRDFSQRFLEKVNTLESLGKSEQTTCIAILQEILETKNFDLLLEGLKYYRHIPESVLVNALHCFLSSTTECGNLLNDWFSKHDEQAIIQYPVIDQIISIQLNEIFMLDHLRKLPHDEAMVLLMYLQYLLENHTYQNETKAPELTQIIDWISMLLDAHFHQLIVMKNEQVYSFLNNLYSLVNLQCKCLEEFVVLQETISLLFSEEKQCHEQSRRDYSIEMLIFE